ncbi:Purple acid phosphatase [Rhynchospora pubera]|uniref:Purple acid phosphatase n=1 Tax=Rhynchospora pubera TaxID=906938 RepID=A0AAV8ALM5_9POAL|nr:Purple acid phosphatase [Rhynchospora pubera]KAJ4795641.1 Purple acid phosphatase [Rhynchospora pubera]
MEVMFSPSVAFVLLLSLGIVLCSHSYQRPHARDLVSVPDTDDSDGTSPQQVHVSIVGTNNMRVSWITKRDAPATVEYGTSPGKYSSSANGNTTSYSYLLYKSGQIHDVIIGPLDPDTVYYYRCSGSSSKEFSFKTPPSNLPINFVVVGDLGQTGWTQTTLDHIGAMPYDMLLLPGDLSYVDYFQSYWDNFGRLVEPLASARPWMVTQGNHEIEKIPLIHPKPFVAYNARWTMPFSLSSSPSNLFYSFDVASSVHVIMLGFYADYGTDSDQYKWLQSDLAKVDRNKTPWLIALIHAPWYNTNEAHQNEGEDMRRAIEPLLHGAGVDVVFAGHVHAYERFTRVYNQKADPCGPVHITIGDGGNIEGLAKNYQSPQPAISLFREASFGHGRFYVVNSTHALWTWHQNDDDVAVIADQVWITSLSSDPTC